ncbi:hypothetical protein QJS04_geneDACA021837 [Acorus gramineus]|uniref:Uncharacterized protein n=1 Tax=Acorus gramineus TaxID=55184 RepID=A0AAV9ADT2_ACOGR|nr:hypothetical protein QJS04_geneDACA021837 [Acorus gramineus]
MEKISGFYPSQEKQPNDEWQISRPRGWLNWISLGMLGVGGTTESSSFIGVVSDEVIKDICEATEFHSSPSFDENTFAGDKLCLSSLNFSICQITTTISSKVKLASREIE